jgi:hypothetical protein
MPTRLERVCAVAKGYLLTGRPEGGKAGTTINRPMNAGEKGRVLAHTHTVSVKDPGHTHVAAVKDPGHDHTIVDPGHKHTLDDPGHKHTSPQHNYKSATTGDGSSHHDIGYDGNSEHTSADKTGIQEQLVKSGIEDEVALTGIGISNLPAESNIEVSLDPNQGGEGYPLAFVLVCERATIAGEPLPVVSQRLPGGADL